MPAAFILSFAQLWDPAIRRILLRALFLTLLLFAGLSYLVFKGVAAIETNGWPTWLQSFWTNGAGDAAAFLLSMLLTWLGFTSIATAVMAMWQDEIIVAVDHMPAMMMHFFVQLPCAPSGIAKRDEPA